MRKLLDPDLLDVEKWPGLCTDHLSEKDVKFATTRIDALKLYLKGRPHKEICAATGLDRRRVLEILNRALEVQDDGRIAGFRSCRRNFRKKIKYTRNAPSQATDKISSHGHAGLMMRLLVRFPKIAERVIAEALTVGSKGFAESAIRFDHIHRVFLGECKEAGVRSNEYPYNVENQGLKGLSQFVKRELNKRHLRKFVNASGGEDAARKLGGSWRAVRVGDQRQCLERVEMDAHRVDCLCVLEIPNPKGGIPVLLPLERFWLLAIVDVVSRAVLGYYVSFSRNYSSEDVLCCFEHALLPWRPRQLSIDGLKYNPDGGFPSGVVPELAYAKWGEIGWDNAKAHCAHWVSDRLRDKIGCTINPGPAARPERRVCIERFFGTMAQRYFQRLPTTTGRNPADPKRRDPEEVAVKYNVKLEELLDLIDVAVSDYNGTVTTALFNRSPLDYLKYSVENKTFFIRHIPEDQREGFSLTLKRIQVVVRGNVKKGVRPFVRFEGVKYFSQKLGASPHLIGKPLILECDTRDLRRLRAFLSNGEELGFVEAAQAWAFHGHDLRVRRAVLRCVALGKIARREGGDPLGDYIRFKERESISSKKPRNELAHAIRVKLKEPSAPILVPPDSEPVRRVNRVPAPALKMFRSAMNY